MVLLRSSAMKRGPIVVATCWCACLNVSALAESCDQRYPQSCRLEVSTTIIKTKGDADVPAPVSRRMKRLRKPVAARVRLAANAPVPSPRPSPVVEPVTVASVSLPSQPARRATAVAKPIAIVDQAFNSLTVSDWTDAALAAALINRRNHILGLMPH